MRLWSFATLVGLIVLSSASALASSALEPTHISLPSGPGSIEGLGRNFAPSLASGTASYGVDIAVPPSAGGFAPHLSIDYDSSGAVTELGMGWRLSGIPRIRRRTENGLPRFDATDAFEVAGMGVACDLLEVASGMFRPEYESGAFVRVQSAGPETWQARDKSGVTWNFGGAGFEEAEGTNVASYLASESDDLHGHRIAYTWDASSGYALLQNVVWNDYGDVARNEIVFSYETRPDSHALFSSGIRQTLTQRMTAIEVRYGGQLVRRYELAYGQDIHSRLASVTLVGRDGTSRMPTLSMGYTAETLQPKLVAMRNAPGRTPSDPNVELSDLDGDGLPDLLVTGEATGQYRSYLNQNGTTWGTGVDWAAAQSPSVSLGTTGVQLADIDGDGAIDLVVKSGTNDFRYFPGNTATTFRAPVAIATIPSFTFEDPDVKLADMDGDRRIDVVLTTADGIAIGYNLNGVDWTQAALVGPVDPNQALRFSDGGHTQLCDVNGDRVEDFCYLTPGSLVYWLGRGRGVFEPAQTATGEPTWDPSSPWELHDLNGDGWMDLVHVGADEVDIALAHAEGQFDPPQTITSVPTMDVNTVVRFADMNGSGSLDIVWIDVAGDPATAWQYLELFPAGRAGLLNHVDNGLGKISTIHYGAAALDAAAANAANSPWTTRINVAMPVVKEVDVDDSLGDPVLTTQYAYSNGTWSPIERTFAGFGEGTETDVGDAYTPTLLTTTTFDVGLVDRQMRGMMLTNLTSDATGVQFTRTTDTWTTRAIDSGTDGRSVEYSFKAGEQVDSIESTDASKARTTLTEWDEDNYGDAITENRWGEVVGGNKLAGNDEALTTRTFANDTTDWILGRLATEELTDAAGNRVRMKQLYYDGAPFQGLPLGQVARGDITRQEAWIGPDPSVFQLDTATAYDSDGHPIETQDARGGGHLFQWDASDRTTLLGESAKLDWGLLVESVQTDRAFGNVTAATGYDGATTTYAYDPFGRLTAIVRPGDSSATPTVQYTYIAAAPLSRVVTDKRAGSDPDERSEDLVDGLGRKRGTLTQDEGNRWVLAGVSLLDARGQRRRSLRARFVTQADHDAPPLLMDAAGVDSWRDAVKRTIQTRTQLGIETRAVFAPLVTSSWDGAQTDSTSPYEHTPVIATKDGLGRLVSTTYTLGGQTYSATFAYDSAGALLSKTDAEGNVSTYAYDGRGRRTLVSDPDAGKQAFVYDATGNIIEHDKPDGTVSRFAFDLGGRPVSEDWDGDGTPEVVHTWDKSVRHPGDPLYLDKLVTMTDPSGSTENEYDARQRVTVAHHTIGGHIYDVGSAYDDQDREVLHVFSDATSVRIHYNPRGQLAGYGNAVSIVYDGDGVELQRVFNTGVVESTGYDGDRRRTESRVLAADGTVVQNLAWSYDGAGNITAVSDQRAGVDVAHDRSEKYAFDNFYRLHTATGPWGNATWTYSPSGNLIERDSAIPDLNAGPMIYGTHAGPHALTGALGRTITYDALGRMTSDGDRAYSWNGDNQLTHVTSASGASMDSIFDGAGMRRVRVEHGPDGTPHTTYFIDPWSEVRDGVLVRFLVHDDKRIAQLGAATGAAGAAITPRVNASGDEDRNSAKARLGMLARLSPAILLIACLFAAVLSRKAKALSATPQWGPAPTMCAFLITLGLISCHGDPGASGPSIDGTVQTLGDGDTLLFDDAIGSLTEQTSGSGTPQTAFAAYPYGLTRFDTSTETRKYASSPRDTGVGLDAMGARAYAPDLGVWTSADPVAVDDPLRSVGSRLGASNPYAYAGQTPTVATDEKGHWWQIVAAALVGSGIGAGVEAYREYSETGHIESWGRVAEHGIATGGAFALAAALPTPATVAEAISLAAGTNAVSGVANRLVDSGGKSAGTVGDVVRDGAIGAAGGAAGVGVAKVFGQVARSVTARSGGAVADAAEAVSPLVYGPSARGALAATAERLHGETLNDLMAQGLKSTDSSVLEFSLQTLDAAAASGRPVVFDLTHMQDIQGVLSGTGKFASTVTGAELRYVQSNWASFQSNVTFCSGGASVGAPWLPR